MIDESRIDELMLAWEEARRQGRRLAAEDLCAAQPELADAVRAKIDALEAMERLLATGTHAASTLTQAEPPVLRVGNAPTEICGYEIERKIAEGGMGIVYQARQKSLGRRVALKMISCGRQSEKMLARFRLEAEAAARLQHPSIVQIYEVGDAAGQPFFSMEYVDGGSLAALAADVPRRAEKDWQRQAAALLVQVARAVQYAHEQGVVHRDLKPSNILLTSGGLPKIADFGLAKRLDDAQRHTQTGDVLGTPSYMAPEQAEGQTARIGPRTDVYALGAVLYELLTGRPPFEGQSTLELLRLVVTQEPTAPTRLTPSLPRDLEAICLKCLEKSPGARYDSAAALADDLERFLNGKPVHARRSSGLRRAWLWLKRHPQWASVVTLAVLGALAGSVLAFQRLHAWQAQHARALALAPQAYEILRRNCHECHGQDTTNVRKGLDILAYRRLLDGSRRIVVPGAPADSRLMQRIADGSMPPAEEETRLARLSEEEVAILRDWIQGGAPPFPATPIAVGPVVPYSEIAAQAKQVLHRHCYECHKYDVARGGIRILHHRLLVHVRKVVVPGRPEESELFRAITSTDDEAMMPPPTKSRMLPHEVEIIRRWIEAGAPPFP